MANMKLKNSITLIIAVILITGLFYFNRMTVEPETGPTFNKSFENGDEITIYKNPSPGLNYFNKREGGQIILMDNYGDEFHAWTYPKAVSRFNIPFILSGGHLVLLEHEGYIARIDQESNVIWENDILAHHDADVTEDHIVTFVREQITIEYNGTDLDVEDELITLVSLEDGSVIEQKSVYDMFQKNNISLEHQIELLQEEPSMNIRTHGLKIFHANSVEVLEKNYNDIFTKGRLLVSFRNLDTIALIDYDTEEIVWMWGEGVLDRQHHPSIMPSGNVLVMDNGMYRDYSRIIEVNPLNNEIVWTYNNDADKEFYTKTMGGVQLLDNGNFLITESHDRRIFEINRDGELVWDFKTTDTVFRATRHSKSCIEDIFAGNVLANTKCE